MRSALQTQPPPAPSTAEPDPEAGRDETPSPPGLQPPPPPPHANTPLALPGYVFNQERNRFFRAVKNPLGTPASMRVASKRMPIVLKTAGAGISLGKASGNGGARSSTVGAGGGAASGAKGGAASGAPASSGRSRGSGRGKGLHSYVMARRSGGTLALPGGFVGGIYDRVLCRPRSL